VRTLQPLRHSRALRSRQVAQIEHNEGQAIVQDGRRTRSALLWRSVIAVLVAAVPVAWAAGVFAPRTVEGLVEAEWVVSRSPARARVVELFVEHGEFVRFGQPLLRLESLDTTRLDVAAAEVEQHRLRLAIAESGGETGAVDLGRRIDLAERAEIEFRLAKSELEVRTAEVEALVRERIAVDAELAQEQARLVSLHAALEERITAARSSTAAAIENHRLASLDASSVQKLHEDGITSARQADSAISKQANAGHEQDEAESLLRALAVEADGLKREIELESRRREARLDELDARLEKARTQLAGSRTHRDLWRALASSRRELLPADFAGIGELRELELELLRSELSEAEARLEAAKREVGSVVVVAAGDGLVEGLLVQVGSAVEADAELVRCYDPNRLRVTAYAEPSQADWFREGSSCLVIPEGAEEECTATVVWSGGAWVSCPPQLESLGRGQGDMRVPIALSCSAQDGLRPNMRVRVEIPRTGESPDNRGS
jgi:multidrug resistance efflux pump